MLADDIHESLIERTRAASVRWPDRRLATGRIREGTDATSPWADNQFLVTIAGNWVAFETRPTLGWAATVDHGLRRQVARARTTGSLTPTNASGRTEWHRSTAIDTC